MGTKVGFDSGKFGVPSQKLFNDVFVVYVYLILFHFHKMQAGNAYTKYLRSAIKCIITSYDINAMLIPFFEVNTPELR